LPAEQSAGDQDHKAASQDAASDLAPFSESCARPWHSMTSQTTGSKNTVARLNEAPHLPEQLHAASAVVHASPDNNLADGLAAWRTDSSQGLNSDDLPLQQFPYLETQRKRGAEKVQRRLLPQGVTRTGQEARSLGPARPPALQSEDKFSMANAPSTTATFEVGTALTCSACVKRAAGNVAPLVEIACSKNQPRAVRQTEMRLPDSSSVGSGNCALAAHDHALKVQRRTRRPMLARCAVLSREIEWALEGKELIAATGTDKLTAVTVMGSILPGKPARRSLCSNAQRCPQCLQASEYKCMRAQIRQKSHSTSWRLSTASQIRLTVQWLRPAGNSR